MKLNGVIAEVIWEDQAKFIIPAILPDADVQEGLAALQSTNIQISKTMCFKAKDIPITRPVFHFVLTRIMHRFKIADVLFLDGLDSQSTSKQNTCTKNFAYFLTTSPWYFVLAYKLGYILVTFFRSRDSDVEQDSLDTGVGVYVLKSVKHVIKAALYTCTSNNEGDDKIDEFIDTSIFGDTRGNKPTAIPDIYRKRGVPEPCSMTVRLSVKDTFLNFWNFWNKVGCYNNIKRKHYIYKLFIL